MLVLTLLDSADPPASALQLLPPSTFQDSVPHVNFPLRKMSDLGQFFNKVMPTPQGHSSV